MNKKVIQQFWDKRKSRIVRQMWLTTSSGSFGAIDVFVTSAVLIKFHPLVYDVLRKKNIYVHGTVSIKWILNS